MNSRLSKKLIFYIFLLANISQNGEATTFNKFWDTEEITFKPIIWSKIPSKVKNTYPIRFIASDHNFTDDISRNNINVYRDNIEIPINNSHQKKDELLIQSEKQSEINDTLYAEGNVLVSYKGNFLKGDSITYDKSRKVIYSKGNISLIVGKQIFKMKEFEYDFNNQKGYLLDVKGLLNTENLIEDIFSEFNSSDAKQLENLIELKKDQVINTPNKINNWIFFSNQILINKEKWKSEKAFFTNDLLESNQVKIVVNSLEAISNKEEIRFKSSLNYLTLDENISIPFWLGDRVLEKSGDNLKFKNQWIFGYDNVDKDGLFVGTKFSSITLFNDFILDLEPQFLIQRTFKGSTKSFVKQGDIRTGDKVRRDVSFADYFGLNSQLKGKLYDWDLEIDKEIYSFDPEKFSNALRFKSNLNKEITFLNSKWNKSFFGVYRDRVWNGSIGEAEIYRGYGSKLEKQNTWDNNGIKKSETFSLGLANYAGEDLNSKDLVDSFKGSLFYSLEQSFPINVKKTISKLVDRSYEYIPEPVEKGLTLNTKLELSYALYENGKNQNYVGFGVGPEFVFGDFKNKYFDYTKISFMPFYKLKNGESMFKFDQISENFILDINFDQQVFGPFILKSNATLNLDSYSEDYGEFIDSKISLNWKKRSYEFGIFYQPHNQSGGLSFNLFGFE